MAKGYDVAIIGGGLVGASLALALSARKGSPVSVALIESFPLSSDSSVTEPQYQPSYDARSTALAWGTRLIYENLGVWETIKNHVTPIKHIHVSDRGRFGATRLDCNDYQNEALGYVVENAWIGRSLLARLSNEPAVDLLCPEEVVEVIHNHKGARIKLASGNEVKAAVAVLADGGRSGIREQLHIDVQTRDYQQEAIIANVTTSKHHDWAAYERFTEQGPMALLPLGEQSKNDCRAALVWTLPVDKVDEVSSLSDNDFLRALQAQFGYRLGRFTEVGERHRYPLVLSLSKEQVRPGLAVVGNAAHALHPVAGQGYNLALRGVVRLAEVIIAAKRSAEPLGELAVLSRYLAEQDRDKVVTVGMSDLLSTVFATENPYFGAFLGLGLAGLDVIGPAKHLLSEQAMGLAQKQVSL